MKLFQIVVAYTKNTQGIGYQGSIPWTLKRDLIHFKNVTSKKSLEHEDNENKQNAVIMGRVTYFSIPEKYRPLQNRLNVVVSTTMKQKDYPDIIVFTSFEKATEFALTSDRVDKVFVIGGQKIYEEGIRSSWCSSIIATEITAFPETTVCDRFFPDFQFKRFNLTHSSNQIIERSYAYNYVTYTKEPPIRGVTPIFPKAEYETCYLDLLKDIIENGQMREDRTGTGTISLFGRSTRFNIRSSFPLLTTKRIGWKSVFRELMWFLRGQTDAKILQRQNVHIWDGNTSREFLDQRGLTSLEEGDAGCLYGFQWRHFGAEYKDCHTDYTGQGFDQIKYVIDKIKNDPYSRRIVLSAWNPQHMHKMALLPCHVLCQFYVDVEKRELSCSLLQRSLDCGLGAPFNIASYSMLTYMIAAMTDLKPGDFIHFIGDAHVYMNHLIPLAEQLKRTPKPFPKLNIKNVPENIEDFQESDFELIDYDPFPSIKMDMAV